MYTYTYRVYIATSYYVLILLPLFQQAIALDVMLVCNGAPGVCIDLMLVCNLSALSAALTFALDVMLVRRDACLQLLQMFLYSAIGLPLFCAGVPLIGGL